MLYLACRQAMFLAGEDVVLIDIKSSTLTLGEVLAKIDEYKKMPEFQDCEIFLDGDRYAIVARPKAVKK